MLLSGDLHILFLPQVSLALLNIRMLFDYATNRPVFPGRMFILYSAPHTLRVTHTQTQQTHKTVRISVRVGPQYVERQETRTQALYMESHMGPPSHDLYVPLFQY